MELRTFYVRAILVLKAKQVLILTVLNAKIQKFVIGDLVLKVKQVFILTVLKAKFNCIYKTHVRSRAAAMSFKLQTTGANLGFNLYLIKSNIV